MNSDEALAKESALMPAVVVNRFRLAVSDGCVRLSFAEEDGATNIVSGRCAVVMSPENAIALRDLINNMIQKIEIVSRRN